MSLTDAGNRYRDAVAVGLGAIHAGAAEVAELSTEEQVEVVVACSDEASHLFLMPRYSELQKALGDRVQIRVLTYQHDIQYLPPVPRADVILRWDSMEAAADDRVVVMEEEMRPLCSPGYAALHADVLNGPVTGWGELTFLNVSRPNEGWSSWEDWFDAVGRPDPTPRQSGYDSYTYVLEAAAAGHGIAIGWRHFIERYLESGALVVLTDGFLKTENRFFAIITEKGRQRAIARKCLTFFERCV